MERARKPPEPMPVPRANGVSRMAWAAGKLGLRGTIKVWNKFDEHLLEMFRPLPPQYAEQPPYGMDTPEPEPTNDTFGWLFGSSDPEPPAREAAAPTPSQGFFSLWANDEDDDTLPDPTASGSNEEPRIVPPVQPRAVPPPRKKARADLDAVDVQQRAFWGPRAIESFRVMTGFIDAP